MATVTALGSTFNTTAGDKTVVATPAAGTLIVVIAASTGVATTAVTDTQSGTYTQVDSNRTGFSTTGTLNAWIRTALVPSAISTTFTATQTSSTGGGLTVLSLTGITALGAAALRSSGGQSTGTSGTTPAPVLSQTPFNTNPIITAVANGTNSATTVVQRTGYTEDFDNGYNTPAAGLEVSHLASGETTATITYGGTTASAFASIALEIAGPITKTQPAIAHISNTVTKTQTAIAHISSVVTKTQPAKATIVAAVTKTQSAVATIYQNDTWNPTKYFWSSAGGIDFPGTNYRYSERFAPWKNVSSNILNIYASLITGVPPTYRIGIQADSGSGTPSGTWLASTTVVPVSGWNALTLDATVNLTKGTVYYVVIQWESGTIGSSNKAKWAQLGIAYSNGGNLWPATATDGQLGVEVLDTNTGLYNNSGTTTPNYAGGFTPTFTIGDIGQPYSTNGSVTAIFTTTWSGFMFKTSRAMTITSFTVKPTKSGTPPNDLLYEVRDSGNSTLRSGTIGNATTVVNTQLTVTLSTPLTLTAGTTIYFMAHTTLGDSTNNYKFSPLFSQLSPGPTYIAYMRWGGKASDIREAFSTTDMATVPSTFTNNFIPFDMAFSLISTQTATANITNVISGSKTQPAVARVARAITKTQPAVGRVANNFTKTQGAIARIANAKTKTQPAVAHIASVVTKTQSSIARIQRLLTKTQPVGAFLQYPFNTLLDPFTSTNPLSTMWVGWNGTTSSGSGKFGGNTSSGTIYLESKYGFNIVGNSVSWKMDFTPNGTNAFQALIDGYNVSTAALWINVTTAGILTTKYGSPTKTQFGPTSTSYNNTTMKYMRVRESAGTIFIDYSGDGTTWTNFSSAATTTIFSTDGGVLEFFPQFTDTAHTQVYNIYDINVASSVLTRTQPAIARIARNVTKTQPVVARIAASLTKSQSARARLAQNFTITQVAKARVVQTSRIIPLSMTASSHITTTTLNPNSSIATNDTGATIGTVASPSNKEDIGSETNKTIVQSETNKGNV